MRPCILLSTGEIILKSHRTRALFQKKLKESLVVALERAGITEYELSLTGGRYLLYTEQVAEVLPVLARVSGLRNFSESMSFSFSSQEDLVKQAAEVAKDRITGKTFGVKVKKRLGDHPFSSADIERSLGSALIDVSAGVNLSNPDVQVKLEIRDDLCFVYTKTHAGMGGLSISGQGRVLCLFSGGIDSPVAAHQMIRRGIHTDFLFVNLMGEKSLAEVSKVYNHLIESYVFSYTPKLYILDGSALVEEIKKNTKGSYRQLALKVALYKAAESLATEHGYKALVTGEAVGQKSSQTLESLLFIQQYVTIPLLRPLISFDKLDVIEKARVLGTLELSEQVKEYCNLSDGPVTTIPTERDKVHIKDFSEHISAMLASVFVHAGSIQVQPDAKPTLEQEHGLTIVDVRLEVNQERRSMESDMALPYPDVLKQLDSFTADKTYLLICEYGVRSEEVAYQLRKKGVKAAGLSLGKYEKYFLKK